MALQKTRLGILLLLIITLSSCTETTMTPPPTLPPPVRLSIATVPAGQIRLQAWIADYQDAHPEVEWELLPMNAAQAQQALAQGQVDLALLDQEPASIHQGVITVTVVAEEAIAIIVHPQNPLGDLSAVAIGELFSGRVTDWGQVGGDAGPVQLYLPPDAALVSVFANQALAGRRLAPQAFVRGSAGSVVQVVASDAGGLGLVPTSAAGEGVAILRVDGIGPEEDGYPWHMPLYLAYGPATSAQAQDFFHLIQD